MNELEKREREESFEEELVEKREVKAQFKQLPRQKKGTSNCYTRPLARLHFQMHSSGTTYFLFGQKCSTTYGYVIFANWIS